MSKIPFVVEFWESKIGENDRSLAIIGAALIDEQLAELLSSFFIDNAEITESLLSQNGPVGSNGTRNQLAFALGLIDKPTYKDIKQISKIRNRFAHISANIDFSDERLRGYAFSLEIPQWVSEPEYGDLNLPRVRFFAGVSGILWHLATESKRLKKEGRRQEPEPIFPLGDREGIEFDES